MKRKFTLIKTMLLALLVMAGSVSAWGQVTYVLNNNKNFPDEWTKEDGNGRVAFNDYAGKAAVQLMKESSGKYGEIYSTIPFNNITSISLNATTSNPQDLQLFYSLDGSAWTDLEDVQISKNANAYSDYAFTNLSTLSEKSVYLKFRASISSVFIYSITVSFEGGTPPPPVVESPSFNPASGNFTDAFDLTIETATGGATIYYTLDGNDPTTSSTKYTAPINISGTNDVTVKAFAVKADMDNSAVATATYTYVAPIETVDYDFVEDFEGDTGLTGTYADGSFTNNGVTWNYGHSRDQENFPIDGKGLMLRRASDSYLEATFPNGVGDFGFFYRKAFTGASARQLEIIVNGTQVATTEEFGSGSGAQDDIYYINHKVNEEGPVTIRIKNVGTTTSNRQTTIDNIGWTNYGEASDYLAAPIALDATPVGSTKFTANWQGVDGADEYELYVYTKDVAAVDGAENLVVTQTYHQEPTERVDFGEDIVVEAGKYYTLSLQYKLDENSEGNGWRIWTTAGADIKLPTENTYFNEKGEWLEVVHTFRVTADLLKLNFRAYTNAILDIKDISLVEAELSEVPVLGSPFTTTELSYEVTGLTKATTYYYHVVAKAGENVSDPSNEISVNTGDGTDVNSIQAIDHLYSTNGNIHFQAVAGETVEVYNVAGQKLATRIATEGLNTLPVNVQGVVIVKVGNKVGKTIIR